MNIVLNRCAATTVSRNKIVELQSHLFSCIHVSLKGCGKDFNFTLTDGLFLVICVHLPYIFALLPGSLSSLVLHANSVRLKIITEDLTDEQQKIVNKNLTQQLQVYVMHNDVSTAKGVCALIE